MTALPAILLLASLAADGGATPDPHAPTVTARVNRTEARVGDVIELTITAVGPRAVRVNLPSSVPLEPFAELDDYKRREDERDLGDGKMRREFVLEIAAYEPGELTVPPVEVTYLGRGGEPLVARTAPLPVKIVSLLANEPEPKLKDNAPPVRVMQRDLLLAYIGGAVAAALLGAVLASVVRRRLRARAAQRPAPPPRPPHEIALERLDRLGTAGLAGDLRPFTFELSEIVRGYLGARFGFESLELTTEELVDELRRRDLRGLVIGEVQGWLAACDLVKFAKVSPTEGEARGYLETAIRIVEATRPRPAPVDQAAVREAAGA